MSKKPDDNEKIEKTIFANALHRAANRKGITQGSIAQMIGKEKGGVGRMFTGRRFSYVPTLIELCNVLEVTPDYLLSPYLYEPENIPENDYQRLLNLLNGLEPDELSMLYEIAESIIENRK